MKFTANKLQDYSDFIQKNVDKVSDLLLYAQAIEDAKEDFRCSQTKCLPEETTSKTNDNQHPQEEIFIADERNSGLPLLQRFVEQNKMADDRPMSSEYLRSQSYNGDLADLQTEINLLRYDYCIKFYLSVTKINLKKCMAYLLKLRKLRITRFVLERNPQILQTLERLRNYSSDVSKWKLKRKDRKNFLNFVQKIRNTANTIFHSFNVIMED